MATVTSPGASNRVPNAGTYGNSNAEIFSHKGALAIGDILRFPVKMPAYSLVTGGGVISDTANAAATFKLGYAAVDGDAAVTDDDAFVVAGTAIATATRVGFNAGVTPPMPTKPFYFIFTLAGGAISASTTLTLIPNITYIGK